MDEEVKIEGNLDINQALQEFEEKSQTEPEQKAVVEEKVSEAPKMVLQVMKWTGIKDQRQANCILLGFATVAIVIALFLFFRGGPKTEPPSLTPLIEQAGAQSDFLY